MGFLLFLLITEVLSLLVLRQHLSVKNKGFYYVSVVIHLIMSLWLWRLFFEIAYDKGFFDTPKHIWLLLNMAGMIAAVVIPRTILIIFHFTGRLIRIKSREYLRWLTTTGMIISILIFSIISFGTLHGRFNFKTENVTIKIKNLDKDLEGVKIVQLSDLHLACFYKHKELLRKVMEQVDSIKPDLILNTGDFVSYGWREFDANDTILSVAKSRYGNFAVLGNHDFGTYHPYFTEADKRDNVLILNNLIKSSGYTVLTDTNTIVKIKNAKIGLIGIYTRGRHPNITHGDLKKAMTGLDSTDLTILLSHDPNQWEEEVASKTNIDITLSGHTHGMQMGIYTNSFKWSPSKYFYPHWGGLFIKGSQVQYVNRGLGVLAIPFRIWMPPEITVITLRAE